MIEAFVRIDGNRRYELQAWPKTKFNGYTEYHCTLTHMADDHSEYAEYMVRGVADETDMASTVSRMFAEGFWKLVPVGDIEDEID